MRRRCAVVLLVGCDGKPADSYDTAKMEMKSQPAQVTSTRHTGSFVSGAAPNFTAELKPVDPEPVKMLATDDAAKAMLKAANNLPMPNQSLDDGEIRQYITYFHWFDQQPAADAKK